jgi:hypothetical protein
MPGTPPPRQRHRAVAHAHSPSPSTCVPPGAGNAPWRALVENGNVAPLDNTLVDLGEGMVVSAFNVPHRNEWAGTWRVWRRGCLAGWMAEAALFEERVSRWSFVHGWVGGGGRGGG